MRKFYLITNSSGCTYWSYKVGREHAAFLSPMHAAAVMKHGDIYINQNNGWMHAACVVTIHKTVEQTNFPVSA
jgi:hypothetical protein